MTFKTVIVYYHYDVYVVCVDVIDSYRRTSVTSYASRGELNELQQLIKLTQAISRFSGSISRDILYCSLDIYIQGGPNKSKPPVFLSYSHQIFDFYRAMQVVLARYCYRRRPSVCLSVCDVVLSWVCMWS